MNHWFVDTTTYSSRVVVHDAGAPATLVFRVA